MDIKRFKMWEDAAANSAGGGGVHGIGVGPKGEPGVDMKKRKKQLLLFTKMQSRLRARDVK